MYERPGFAHLFCDAIVLVKELEERDLRHQSLVLEEGWRRHVQRQHHKRRGFLHGCRRARVSAAKHSAMPWRETGRVVSVRRRMDEDEGALVGRGNGGRGMERRLRIVCHGRFAATTASGWALLVMCKCFTPTLVFFSIRIYGDARYLGLIRCRGNLARLYSQMPLQPTPPCERHIHVTGQ